MRIVKEKKAQRNTNNWAESRGIMHTTLTLRGRRGWPDEIYWVPGGRPLLIEFKAEGEVPRKLQAYIHEQLRESGYEVEVHTKAEEAIASIKRRLAPVPEVQTTKTTKAIPKTQPGKKRCLLVS